MLNSLFSFWQRLTEGIGHDYDGKKEFGSNVFSGYASLKLGETPLTLVATQADQFVPQTSHAPFTFFVPDAEAARAHLTNLGIECTPIVTDSVTWFDCCDIDGNLLSVCHWQ